MHYIPQIIKQTESPLGTLQLVEWLWPDILEFRQTEQLLMLEMSLPPYSTDASAEFPAIAPGMRCFMGTMFVRYPGIELWGRGEGVKSRVLRMVFSSPLADQILSGAPNPSLEFLQSLLDIRSDAMREIFRLALRELTLYPQPSSQAIDAYVGLMGLELVRLFDRSRIGREAGRLAPWQHRKIRERLTSDAARPSTAELANLCGISARHLHRQFYNLTGKTIANYVQDFWVERSKLLLRDSQMPIRQIAANCGFTHPNSFARSFKRATGVLPNQFRQNLHQL